MSAELKNLKSENLYHGQSGPVSSQRNAARQKAWYPFGTSAAVYSCATRSFQKFRPDAPGISRGSKLLEPDSPRITVSIPTQLMIQSQ